jgi:hypothetical protein
MNQLDLNANAVNSEKVSESPEITHELETPLTSLSPSKFNSRENSVESAEKMNNLNVNLKI